MGVRSIDEHGLGLSWVAADALYRGCHALADGGRVWLVEPVDAGDALERARALGDPVAVLQLYGNHGRDCAAVAQRLGVPHLKVPAALPETPFSVLPLHWGRLWREVALWWPERTALVVPESIGTSPLFAVGEGPAGMHPLRRLSPPWSLRAFLPEHLLVGHGAPLHGGDAGGGLIDALERARSDIPRVFVRAGSLMRGMLSRR